MNNELRVELTDALLQVPATNTFDGRTALLAGIPNVQSLQRSPTISRTDIDLIVSQLAEIHLQTGEWALVIFIGNALSHVQGTTLSATLQRLRQQVQSIDEDVGMSNSSETGTAGPQPRTDPGDSQTTESPKIVLSYAHTDQQQVEDLYERLADAGYTPWMDRKDILPGQRWLPTIQKAISEADFFLACLSRNSVNRRGVIQREIKQALDAFQEYLSDDIYLIPVRLEACDAPEELKKFHWVDFFEPDGWTRLIRALEVGMEMRQD